MGRATSAIHRARAEPFNDRAYALIVTLLDEAEEWLVKNGRCEPVEAMDVLTRYYIECVGNIVSGATVYLASDERAGADIFLWRICPKKHRRTFDRNARMMAEHLANHTTLYFPNYAPILHLSMLEKIASIKDGRELRLNGVVLLSVASLPGARSSIRRVLRRRGCESDPLLIHDDDMNRRIGVGGSLNTRRLSSVPNFYS